MDRPSMIEPNRVSLAISRVLARRRRLSPLADEIGARIVSGELAEGRPLSERMFAPARGVSRTSFREAAKVLEGKGLVRAKQNTGTLVSPRSNWQLLDPDVLAWRIGAGNIDGFIQDFFDFRASIEPLAAESAARRCDPVAIAIIREALETMRSLEETEPFGEDYVSADVQFHSGIFRAASNEFLVAVGHMLEVPLMLSFTLHSSLNVGPPNRLELHHAVLEEISRGNASGARTASLALLHDVAHHAHDIVVDALAGEDADR